MAQTFTSPQTGTVVVPSAFTSLQVQSPVAGLSAAGIIALIGEANSGPATSLSTQDITTNFFTPDQLGDVIAKYGSGNLVDGFRAAASASNDGGIVGAPTRIYLYKTNSSVAASGTVLELGQSSYGTLSASLAGTAGNLLSWQISSATAHVEATSGSVAYMPAGIAYNLGYRLEGGAAVTVSIGANTLPSVLASNTSSLQTNALMVTGGADRLAFAGLAATTLTGVTASGNVATWTLTSPAVFPVAPVVGDTLYIPTGSAFAGAGNANCGYWEITTSSLNNATTAQFVAVKLNNNVATTVTAAPINVATTFSATVANDMICYSPIKLTDKNGVNRGSFLASASTNVSATATGSTLVVALATGTFGSVISTSYPRVNGAVYIPAGSAIVGAASANQGWYTITAVTTNTLTLSRLSNGSPATVTTTALSSTPDTTDIQVIRTYVDGESAALEIYDAGGSVLPLTRALFNLGTTTSSSVISSLSTPAVEFGTDRQIGVTITRATDGTQESYTPIGGNVVLEVGYLGTTATLAIGATTITATVTGGSGASWSTLAANYPTVNDLVNFINGQTGFSAAVPSSAAGLLPVSALDQGTFGICSSVAAASLPGRIKRDAYDFAKALSGSPTVTFTAVSKVGLPESTSAGALLTGGAKGGTTGAQATAAIDAMANIDVNFITPLFSQDASADITAGLTDASSTYTIAGINAYLSAAVNSLSGQVKRKKNRLAVGSFRGTFAAAQAAAASIASARFALTFQDVKNVSINGQVVQFQPWMGAVIAASMQAVGLYRSINHKYAQISGIVSPSGDFSPGNYGQLEQALNAGLLTLEAPAGGGFRWVSDQTTYGRDGNFVYNSLQVMYTADFMALDLARSFDNFAVGQAVADVSAVVAKSFLQAKMSQYLQAKLISPSNGAAAGYDSAVVTLSGPVLNVAVNAYITNAISFVPIVLSISQVQQSS